MPLLYTTAQTQTELGLGRTKIDELVHKGELEVVFIGRAKRVTSESLLAFIRRQTESNPARATPQHPAVTPS